MRAIPTLFDGDRIRSLDGTRDFEVTSARSYGDAYAVEIITDEDGNEQQGEEILLSTNELRGCEVVERDMAKLIEYLHEHDWSEEKATDAFDILAEACGLDLEEFEDADFNKYNDVALDAILWKMPWYAIVMDEEDTDWGTGSYHYEEAVEMAKRMEAKEIAIIKGYTNPTCDGVIEDF